MRWHVGGDVFDCGRELSWSTSILFVFRDGWAQFAAYAVPSGIAEGADEIMLAVVPGEAATIDPVKVAAYADRMLPRFAQPRFIEIVDSLPKTPTAKVQKAALRSRGITAATWDRQVNRST
jgi:crotonobetaine/carnitine-CoA ligase